MDQNLNNPPKSSKRLLVPIILLLFALIILVVWQFNLLCSCLAPNHNTPRKTVTTKPATITPTATPTEAPPQVFSVYGDSRWGDAVHRQIITDITAQNPLAVFNTGDLVTDGNNASQWQTFNSIVAKLPTSIKYYPVLGNHEGNAKLYYDNFQLPNNERWYLVEFDKIYFIVLDSNAPLTVGSEQYNWFNTTLSGLNKSKFIAVLFHHPPFNTGTHGEDEKRLRQSIVPLMEENSVDIVLNGHDHCYERSYNNGIYYIISAGGGASLYSQTRQAAYSQKFLKVYNYTILKPSDKSLSFQAFDENNKLIDELSIANKP